MTSPIFWMLALGPAALLAAALWPATIPMRLRLTQAAAGLSIAVATAGVALVAAAGPMATGTLGISGAGLSLSLDLLSAIMLLLVSFIGGIVLRFSVNYLAGDAGQGRFTRWLAATLAAVLVLILAGNMLLFILAWIATSLALNRLLLFYPKRPGAILAARKKAVVSRLGDVALVAAALLLHGAFGTLDHAALAADVRALAEAGAVPGAVQGAALLIAAAALLKSAQFPLHGWLLEVMETPTPVSALLHAGVINAGGYLLLRHADLLVASAPSTGLLVAIGGVTALYGSVVMLTQPSVKVALAYSTIAQMGFMMLQIGLGAFAAGLLHIVAHSLYKAHAFLSSGSVIDLARASWRLGDESRPRPARILLVLSMVAASLAVTATVFGATLVEKPGVFALAAIMVLGLVHLVASGVDDRPVGAVVARTIVLAIALSAAWFAVQAGAAALMAGTLPPVQPLGGVFDLVMTLAVVAGFAAITVLQSTLWGKRGSPAWQAFRVHASHGFYVNTLANRLVIRLWPGSPAPAANPKV